MKVVKSFDACAIPPYKAEMFKHLMRALYVGNIWSNAHLQYPSAYENALTLVGICEKVINLKDLIVKQCQPVLTR